MKEVKPLGKQIDTRPIAAMTKTMWLMALAADNFRQSMARFAETVKAAKLRK